MILKIFKNILSIGSGQLTSSIERKRNKMLVFSILLLAFTVVFFTVLDFLQGIINLPIAINFAVQICFISLIIVFLYNNKWQTARLLFITLSLFILIIQNNFLFKGFYGEYLYLTIPLLSMFFFDRKAYYFLTLILALILFYVPNFYLKIYPDIYFGYANVVFLFVGIFSIVYFFKNENIKAEEQLITANKKLDIAFKELEISKKNEIAVSNLKALQSQMNPHFIFNALNSVQDLVLLQDIRNSNRYLGKFSDLIRKILLSSKKQFITLEEEIEILNLYLDLEKLRFGEEFIVDFRCDISEAKQYEIMLPAMFIQPYIENAIKHGLFHKEGIKKLKVSFELKADYVQCIVEDNGVGQIKAEEFKVKSLHLHTGFSTEAINDRIRLLNETLDRKIELKVEDLYDNETSIGTKITLLFPV